MIRLTGKTIENKNYKVRKPKEQCWENAIQNCINKLGKLEDIEDELGCPLEVVFKALKEDIIDTEGSRVSVGLEYIQASKEWLLIGKFCRTAYDVKDYGKTWWLKGEKLCC